MCQKDEVTGSRNDKGEIVKGLETGLRGMCVGEKRTLTIPSGLAFGAEGSADRSQSLLRYVPPGIPGGATVQYEVELLSGATGYNPAAKAPREHEAPPEEEEAEPASTTTDDALPADGASAAMPASKGKDDSPSDSHSAGRRREDIGADDVNDGPEVISIASVPVERRAGPIVSEGVKDEM